MAEDSTVGILGANLRRMREAMGLSLSALARMSGVAKATLSALEGGGANPTIATLEALATSLQVPLPELLVRVEARVPRIVRGTEATRPGTDDRLLETFSARGVVEVYDIRYEPGARAVFQPHPDGVMERVLVHNGVLRTGPVDNPAELEAGDFISFPADQDHVFEAVEGTVRGVLMVSYPQSSSPDSPVHRHAADGGNG